MMVLIVNFKSMQAIDIKNRILPLISTYLGTYQPTGQPAVNIGLNPIGWNATGLELAISAYPTRVYIKNRIKTEVWNWQLNQFGDGNEIYTATKILQDKLDPQPDVVYVESKTVMRLNDLSPVRTSYFTLDLKLIYYVGSVVGG